MFIKKKLKRMRQKARERESARERPLRKREERE